jgi:competence protein ComGC
MKKNSHRLFMMEIVLCILILFISLSVTNLIFVRSMLQHQKNEAMIKMSESMVMISENIQSENLNKEYLSNYRINYDSNGNKSSSMSTYQVRIDLFNNKKYIIYRLSLFDNANENLLSWDVVKVVE